MTQRAKTQRASSATPTSVSGLRSLLVPIDLTPATDRVLGRAALLPLVDGARITLLHVVPGGLPFRARRSAERDAKKALAEEAGPLARSLPKTVRVEAVVKAGMTTKVIAELARSTEAELVVMGRGSGRAVRDSVLGSTAERVIRRGQLPVLVVRRPARASYRRPMLAIDLDDAARSILPLALRVLPPPRPLLHIVHAYTTAYDGLVYPSLSDDPQLHRELRRELAPQLSSLLLAAAAADLPPGGAPPWTLDLRHGSARLAIEKAVEKADTDLLLLGTRGRTGLAHLLLGTVAGDVLRHVRCDVLIVPPLPSVDHGDG